MDPNVQVTLRWGERTMRTTRARLAAGAFVVGEGAAWALPEEALGGRRFELLRRAPEGAGVQLAVPEGASAHVWREGERPAAATEAAHTLLAGGRASVALGDISIDVAVDEGVRAKMRRRPTLVALWPQGASAALHAAIIAIFVLVAPRAGEGAELERDRLDLLTEVSSRDAEDLDDPTPSAGGDEPSGGAQPDGAIDDSPVVSSLLRGLRGGRPNGEPTSAYDALREAATFGIIGILAGGIPSEAAAARWGRAATGDPGMWGGGIDSLGFAGGLGLSGESGSGDDSGSGISLGNFGSLGRGSSGSGATLGRRRGPAIGVAHTCEGPATGCATSVNGRLPPEIIQRIVRQNFGRFRLCYEQGLRTQPGLGGRVTAKFVIDRSGAVAVAQDAGSDLPNPGVVACVVRTFETLSFPQPEGGLVTVVYPIIFDAQ